MLLGDQPSYWLMSTPVARTFPSRVTVRTAEEEVSAGRARAGIFAEKLPIMGSS